MNPFKYGCTVEGDCFCRRPKLAKRLKEYIKSGQNVVIQGERRMGKTSLVLETVRGMKGVALYHADFLFVRDRADLCRRLAFSRASPYLAASRCSQRCSSRLPRLTTRPQ